MHNKSASGWREVLAIVFEGVPVEFGVTPKWLVNPDTGRRLKLDNLYPDIGVAVRIVGQTGTGRRRRKSDEEVAQEVEREETRADVCRANGIVLITIDPDEEPRTVLREMEMALARATALLAKGPLPHTRKVALIPQLSEARRRAGSLTTSLRTSEQLNSFADRWFQRLDTLASEGPTPRPPTTIRPFRIGMAVRHQRFGRGKIVAVNPSGGDIHLGVAFDDGSAREFLASLVGDLLLPE